MLGDRDAAIKTRRRVVEVYDARRKQSPDDAAEAVLFLGNLQRLAGRPDDAVRTLREALKQFEEMRYETKIALAQADLGRLLFDMG